MQKFKPFQRFKRYARKPDAKPTLTEKSGAKDYRLRDIHRHLTDKGWAEDRHSGGHKIYKHPDKPHSITVPAHPTAPISPGVARTIFRLSEDAPIISEGATVGLTEDMAYGGGRHKMSVHEPAGLNGVPIDAQTRHLPDMAYDIPHGHYLKHSYTDTTMEYSRHHRRPSPVHTHHMSLEAA